MFTFFGISGTCREQAFPVARIAGLHHLNRRCLGVLICRALHALLAIKLAGSGNEFLGVDEAAFGDRKFCLCHDDNRGRRVRVRPLPLCSHQRLVMQQSGDFDIPDSNEGVVDLHRDRLVQRLFRFIHLARLDEAESERIEHVLILRCKRHGPPVARSCISVAAEICLHVGEPVPGRWVIGIEAGPRLVVSQALIEILRDQHVVERGDRKGLLLPGHIAEAIGFRDFRAARGEITSIARGGSETVMSVGKAGVGSDRHLVEGDRSNGISLAVCFQALRKGLQCVQRRRVLGKERRVEAGDAAARFAELAAQGGGQLVDGMRQFFRPVRFILALPKHRAVYAAAGLPG